MRFRCLNCGHMYDIDVMEELDWDFEVQERRCPKCGSELKESIGPSRKK